MTHTTPSTPAGIARDVLIVGAGPAGLALAAALARAGLSSAVLEQQPLAALESPAEDGREIALTHRSRRLMQSLGLWQHLPPHEVSPLHEARVLNAGDAAALRFAPRPADGGPLGWLVPNHRIRAAARAAALQHEAVQLHGDARVAALSFDAQRAEAVLADGRRFSARLVVAADSRLSPTRRAAGIGAEMRDFGRSVIVGRVAHEADHGGMAWEHFRIGSTLALLPLNARQVSAVVTVPAQQAPQWLALSDAQFAARIHAQSAGRLGAMRSAGPRHHWPLVGVCAHRFAGPRFALVGDAAVGMHPVTAHGWNFGLYGIEALVAELAAAHAAGRDVGAPDGLQRYAAVHRRATWPVYQATNAIVALFTDDRPPARLARSAALAFAGRLPPFDRWIADAIVHRLTGDAAAPPRMPEPWHAHHP